MESVLSFQLDRNYSEVDHNHKTVALHWVSCRLKTKISSRMFFVKEKSVEEIKMLRWIFGTLEKIDT